MKMKDSLVLKRLKKQYAQLQKAQAALYLKKECLSPAAEKAIIQEMSKTLHDISLWEV